MSHDPEDRSAALIRRLHGEGTLAVRPEPVQRGTKPPPRGPKAGPWTPPRSAADRGPGEFNGFEDFADFGEEPEAGFLGDGGAFGGSSLPEERGAGPSGGAPGFDLSRWRIRDEVLNLLTRDLVERHHAIPLMIDGEALVVAMADPAKPGALEELASHTGREVQAVRAPREAVWARILEHYRA